MSQIQSGKTILLVDDLEEVRDFYRDVVEEKGWQCLEAFDAVSFEQALKEPHDAILLDLAMPTMTGIEGLHRLAERGSEAFIVIASGQDEPFLNMALKLGRSLGLNMVTRLQKPINLSKLENMLDLIEQRLDRQLPMTG